MSTEQNTPKTPAKKTPAKKATPKPSNLVEAINQVMSEVKSVGKNKTIGQGRNSYKWVSDVDVKQVIQPALVRAGLILVPTKIEPTIKVERWTEDTQYGPKQKQSVFTEAKVTYVLWHTSGEQIEVQGYGHGIDSQDKAAGKATTYALKYALLYLFLVPTGEIDDSDTDHSDNKPVPQKKQAVDNSAAKDQPKPPKGLTTEEFDSAIKMIENGRYTADKLEKHYKLTTDQLQTLSQFRANE